MEPHVFLEMAEQDVDSWYYRAKRQWLRNMLTKHMTSLSRVIDIGCGTGRNASILESFLNPDGEYIGIEPHPLPFCPPAHMRSRLIHLPLEKIGPDELIGPADLVMMVDVLEHVDEDGGLERAAQFLMLGGHLLVTVPAYMSLWSKSDIEAHHLRRYTFRGLNEALQRHGFEILDWNHYFSFAYFPLRLLGASRPQSLFGPRWLGKIILPFAFLEAWTGKFLHMPIGTGIVCIAKKV